MKISQEVRDYAAEQETISIQLLDETVEVGVNIAAQMAQKSKEFTEQGSEIYKLAKEVS